MPCFLIGWLKSKKNDYRFIHVQGITRLWLIITEPQRNHVQFAGNKLLQIWLRFRARKSCIFSLKLVRRESIVLSSTKHVYLLTASPFLPYLPPSIHSFSTSIQLFLSIPDDRAIVEKRHGYLRIIPWARVGYEVVNSQLGAITISYRKGAKVCAKGICAHTLCHIRQICLTWRLRF